MAALEQIDTLRQQNRDLLKKLKKQSDKLRQLILLRVDAHCTPSAELHGARCASPTVEHPKTIQISDEYLSERHEDPTPDQHKHRQSSEVITHNTLNTHNTLLQDTGNSRWTGRRRSVRLMLPDSAPLTADSHQSVTDSAVAAGLETVSDRRIQPLLGYDWIAGLLDAESSLADRSEQFFSELRSFRHVNRDECVHNLLSGLPSVADLASSTLDGEEPQTPADTHQCTFCYRINSRLFAVPLDAQAACPVCKMPKIKHPHTKAEPALIRVSIPHSALLPAHQYKAHRRSSFDSSDSLSLPSHCLSGWSNPTLHSGSQVSSLDLRGSMAKPAAMRGSSSSWADSTLDSPLPSASRRPVQNVSRLPRYAFRTQRDQNPTAALTHFTDINAEVAFKNISASS